jgi:hypothetical protein
MGAQFLFACRILLARCRCQLALGNFRKALEDAESVMESVDEWGKPIVPIDAGPDIWSTKEGAISAGAALCKAEALFQMGNFEHAAVWFWRQLRMRSALAGHEEMKSGVAKCQVTHNYQKYMQFCKNTSTAKCCTT